VPAAAHTASALVRCRDQTNGNIPSNIDPDHTAVTLVALAEGLATYVLLNIDTAQVAKDRILTAINDIYIAARS
jgi:hypothetical protein